MARQAVSDDKTVGVLSSSRITWQVNRVLMLGLETVILFSSRVLGFRVHRIWYLYMLAGMLLCDWVIGLLVLVGV